MDKFGLFDLISKLSSNENTINSLAKVAKSVIASKEGAESSTKPTSNKNLKKSSYNTKAICDLIKRHDELSKQIDEKNKNIRPKN